MYTSPEDARSDLFLSGAVYLFGPTVVGILLGLVGLGRIPVVQWVLAFVLPLATTVVVPWLLMRYRNETLRDFGVGVEGAGLAPGLLAALPLVGVAVVVAVVGGRSPLSPFFAGGGGGVGQTLAVVQRLVHWLGLIALALYCTVKARDAFRMVPRTLRDGAYEVGRVVAIVAAVTTLLLLVATRPPIAGLSSFVLMPLGVAGTVWVALRQVQGPTSVSRAVLITPVVLLALRPFVLFGPAATVIQGAWTAALLGGVGLAVAVLLEGRRSALPAIGLALAVALATPL